MSNVKPAVFSLEGTPEVHGYSDGTTWNGFAVPLFDDAQLDAFCEMMRNSTEVRVTRDFEGVTFAWPDEYGIPCERIGKGPDGLYRFDVGMCFFQSEPPCIDCGT